MRQVGTKAGRRILRRLAWRIVPATMSERARSHERGLRVRGGIEKLAREFVDVNGSRVLSGPCEGTDYARLSLEDVDAPIAKLLGAYECELHATLNRIVKDAPEVIVDIGCAEGYYVVGLAKAIPNATVYAFDLSASARELCRSLARANDVSDRVEILGRATPNLLTNLPLDGAFVLSDCEGAEKVLFGREDAELFATACLLIEVHGGTKHALLNRLKRTFEDTHSPEVIVADYPRDASMFNLPQGFDVRSRALALSEGRKRAEWLMLTPLRDS